MFYSVFGLTLESEIELPELIPANHDAADIHIRLGSVPDTLFDITGDGALYQINARQFRLEVQGVARYFVEDGREITLDLTDGADMASVRLFLLGSAMGALLHQRGLLPLHASSIVHDHGAVLFCGHSQIGKSTTAAAFRKQGYPMLSDDISVLALNDQNQVVIVPGMAQQKLWEDALAELGETGHQYERIRPQLEKYAVPVRDQFHHTPLPVNKIFLLQIYAQHEINIEPIAGLAQILRLSDFTYRRWFLSEMGSNPQNARLLTQLAKQADIYSVQRPNENHRLAELIERLKVLIQS